MSKTIRPLNIEGSSFEVEWEEFEKGASFFIPCLNRPAATTIIKRKAKALLMDIMTHHRIEDGFRGVRVWRL